MDMNAKGLKGDVKKNNSNNLVESKKESPEGEGANGESDDESRALLQSKSEKPKRNVQWLDKNGDKLVQILEFEPSDISDSDEDEANSCICTIM